METIMKQQTWCITGVAGFIGSHLLEYLLKNNQTITGLDNLSTGHRHNLDSVKELVSPKQWQNFTFINGDICNIADCNKAVAACEIVLHQAALGSVPRSIANPLNTHNNNVNGFINMLHAAKENNVKRFVYASSSSVYGDSPILPKVEDKIGKVLSPYAASKYTNEIYADAFSACYDIETIGLRYFNVFGPRQDPNGPYAAVIPKWIDKITNNEPVQIYGDGETSRDFCYVANAVQANILAAITCNKDALNTVYNVAVGDRTTLNELFTLIKNFLGQAQVEPEYSDFRAGDVQHSQANISKAAELLEFKPTHDLQAGLKEMLGISALT